MRVTDRCQRPSPPESRGRRGVRAAVLALAWLAACDANAAGPSPERRPIPSFRVIVHPQLAIGGLDRRELTDIFLKKKTRWPNGQAIHVVDLAANSPTRARFTEDVMGRSVAAVKSYWQQIIFAGRGLPPPELASDDAVMGWVLRHSGGIGYVSGAAEVGPTRIVPVR